MTKKIKFLDDAKTSSILVVTANKIYLITEETETHYTFYDDDNIKTSIYKLKSGFKFEIIEEPKVTKYIKFIDFNNLEHTMNPGISLHKYYALDSECIRGDNYYGFFNDNKEMQYFDISKLSPIQFQVCEGHPHKHLIKKATELAESTIDVGSHFQMKLENGEWVGCGDAPCVPDFHPDSEYRLKPRTIKIGNREINAPEREPLKQGQKYWIPCTMTPERVRGYIWDSFEANKLWLERDLVFLTKEDAIAATEAMIELLRGGD